MSTTNVYQDIEHVVSQPSAVPWNIRPPESIPADPPPVPVGLQLETARVRKMWSLAQLSRHVNMQSALLDRFETGTTAPDVCAMHILCKELGLVLQ